MCEVFGPVVIDKDKLELVKLVISIISLISLIGIFAAMLSMRVAVCNQLYARWQSLLFKFADVQDAHENLTVAYTKAQKSRSKAHFIAVAYVNLFEEAYRYRHARFACIWPILPEPFWNSIVKSMTKQFSNYLYFRTFWVTEKDSFSDDFNAFVQAEIIPKCPRFNEV